MKVYTSKKHPKYGLKRAREEAGLTQQQLCEKLNVHIKTVMNWEQGISFPPMDTLLTLCDFYDCDLDYLTGRIDCKTHDIQFIHEKTGLSEKAIEKLIAWKEEYTDSDYNTSFWSDILSKMIENDLFDNYMEKLHQSIIALKDEQSFFDNASSNIVSTKTKDFFENSLDAPLYRLSRISSDLAETIIKTESQNGASERM